MDIYSNRILLLVVMKYCKIDKNIALKKLQMYNRSKKTKVGILTEKTLNKRNIKIIGFCDMNEKDVRKITEDNVKDIKVLKTMLRKTQNGFMINNNVYINEKCINNRLLFLRTLVHEVNHYLSDKYGTAKKNIAEFEYDAYIAEYKFIHNTDIVKNDAKKNIKKHIHINYDIPYNILDHIDQ